MKKENFEGNTAFEARLLELLEERDIAAQDRDKAQNELQRALSESQMKDCRISNLNEMLASKETVIEKLQGENSQIGKRLEGMAIERQKYMQKVETILSEQKELRSKDKTLFNQVSLARDQLQ